MTIPNCSCYYTTRYHNYFNKPNISLYRAAACIERRAVYSREKGVRQSVSLSVKRVDCDKTEEKSVQIFIPYERPFSLVF